mmetsp:Transcript_45827/g.109115  ORF Transcript_45827/g.109115 Transcript_45827/m.109115 type:complete len:258 (+) Transcript_45827:527-1300(+)
MGMSTTLTSPSIQPPRPELEVSAVRIRHKLAAVFRRHPSTCLSSWASPASSTASTMSSIGWPACRSSSSVARQRQKSSPEPLSSLARRCALRSRSAISLRMAALKSSVKVFAPAPASLRAERRKALPSTMKTRLSKTLPGAETCRESSRHKDVFPTPGGPMRLTTLRAFLSWPEVAFLKVSITKRTVLGSQMKSSTAGHLGQASAVSFSSRPSLVTLNFAALASKPRLWTSKNFSASALKPCFRLLALSACCADWCA